MARNRPKSNEFILDSDLDDLPDNVTQMLDDTRAERRDAPPGDDSEPDEDGNFETNENDSTGAIRDIEGTAYGKD